MEHQIIAYFMISGKSLQAELTNWPHQIYIFSWNSDSSSSMPSTLVEKTSF